MRSALVFLSGCITTIGIFWYVWPMCSFGAFVAGFMCALIAMGVTFFVESTLLGNTNE